jgi:hypothetical protein
MIRGICLSTIAFAMLAAPAFAAENTCKAPAAPTVPDGKTAAAHDLVVAAGDVKKFIADSDTYQQCLNDWFGAEQVAATKEKKEVDSKIKEEHDKLGDQNQKEKERVGGLYNTAAQAYRAAHPK